jgi:hypothetical protein
MGNSPLQTATALVSRWWQLSVVDRYRLWSVRIDGVEVTQSIQSYHAADHLTDANDRSPDNSVQLVANKAAWVRVYVRSGLVSSVAGVTGTLQVERRRLGFVFDPPETFNPQPPGNVTTQDLDYATERGSVANTLNFIIPAESFAGTMRLTVRLTDSSGSEYDTSTLMISAALVQTLRVRAIRVSYQGPSTAATPMPGQPAPVDIQLAAPTLADLQATAALALRVMPVEAEGDFATAGTVLNWTVPLDDPRTSPGSCSPNWDSLLDELTNRRTNDGNRTDVVYYGLLPAGIPLGVPGCGQGGLGSAAVGDQGTFLHEIGHGYGFQHTPCGNAGATDVNYPTYEPYASASIGEYGLDISNGNVFSPQTAVDYMSYCSPRWMSLYQHSRLIGHARLDPRWIVEHPWWRDYLEIEKEFIPRPDPPPYDIWSIIDMVVNPIISITGIVRSPKEVEVTTVARVMAAGMPPGVRTPLKAHLLNDQGKTVAEGAIFRLNTQGGCGCDDGDGDPATPPYHFQAFLSDTEPGAELRIMDGEEKIWSRRAPDRRPKVARFDAAVTKDDQLELRWETESSAEKPDVWAQWSDDQGKSWHGLTTGLAGGNATLGISGLPQGDILVRVLVHDGFFTAVSDSFRVTVPVQAPEVAILHPREGQTLYAGRTLQLWGAATSSAGKPLPSESNRWLLDDREVARGNEAWLETPAEGEHKATFIVRWEKGEIVRSVRFRTISGEKNSPRSSSHHREPHYPEPERAR